MGCDAHRAHFGRGEERVKWSSRPEWMACGQGGVVRKPRPGVASARSPEEDRSHMATPVIVAAARTAIGTLGGALAQLPATKLGAIAVREATRRAKLEPAQVEEVILGHVLPAGLGLNPGRGAAPEARLPKEIGSYTAHKACGSGMKAAVPAAQALPPGGADGTVGGGAGP